MNKQKHTDAELSAALRDDLLNDARCSEEQAASGPYYMDGDRPGQRVLCITDEQKAAARAELLSYAAECRTKAQTTR